MEEANARYEAEWNKWAANVDQATKAGNQLASLQTLDARQLRELMATHVQSELASQMKAEKESQMEQELWRDVGKTDRLIDLRSKPDPF